MGQFSNIIKQWTLRFRNMPQWRVPISKLLLFVAMAIVIHPQQASGKLHLTYHGTFCLGSCKLDAGNYYCDSIARGETEIKSMFCSPKNQTTVQGKKCVDECAQHGQNYYWCYTNNGFLFRRSDKCGPVWDNTNYITSTYEALCYDQCATNGEDYYWCNTRKGWDYCSPRPNVDYQNNPCRANHPCAKHDKNYYWCYLKKGSWGYCGLQTPKTAFFRSSTYRELCRDNCEYYSQKGYYFCYTSKGWDYCSPWPDVTYRGVSCRDDHSCDLHGENYYWCKTNNSWDYCGVVEGFECQCSHGLRTKRQEQKKPDVCRCRDEGNQREFNLYFNRAANIAGEGTQFQDSVEKIIALWNNELLTTRSKTLVVRFGFRIDMQGMVNRDNQRYYNLQIQRNVPRERGQSTTYSQVLVPENLTGIPTRYVRDAFLRSYRETAGVTIEVSFIKNPRRQQ